MSPSTKTVGRPSEKDTRLPTWRVVLSLIRFRSWLWVFDLAAITVRQMCWGVVSGLVMRAFFDLLTGDAPVRLGIWSIAALIVAIEVAINLAGYRSVCARVPLSAHIATLLRKNMLKHILNRPGASALPDSPGEAVSRFRGDVLEIPHFVIWIKYILVGVTYLDAQGKLDYRQQLHGIIEEVSLERGIVISLRGAYEGDTWAMPPMLSAIRPAEPGTYQLQMSGEEVEDPDLLASWTMQAPPE